MQAGNELINSYFVFAFVGTTLYHHFERQKIQTDSFVIPPKNGPRNHPSPGATTHTWGAASQQALSMETGKISSQLPEAGQTARCWFGAILNCAIFYSKKKPIRLWVQIQAEFSNWSCHTWCRVGLEKCRQR